MSAPEKPRPVDERPLSEDPPPPPDEDPEPTILGFPSEPDEDDDAGEPALRAPRSGPDAVPAAAREPGPDAVPTAPREAGTGRPRPAVRLVVHRRADRVGGVLMVLAGAAAGASLALPWVRGDGTTGWSRFRQGMAVLGSSGIGVLGRGPLWEPLAVASAGVLLLALGLLVWVPAHSHRTLGVLALAVAALAGTGAVVPLARAGWSAGPFAPGAWCAVAVAGLGLLGALKAMLTAPRITVRPRPAGGPPAQPRRRRPLTGVRHR